MLEQAELCLVGSGRKPCWIRQAALLEQAEPCWSRQAALLEQAEPCWSRQVALLKQAGREALLDQAGIVIKKVVRGCITLLVLEELGKDWPVRPHGRAAVPDENG